MRQSPRAVLAAGALLLAGLVPLAHAAPGGPCTDAMPAGGWAAYGGPDGMGTNRQDAETQISPSTVGRLSEVWRVVTAYQSEPIVSGGCVFVTSAGAVKAYDLDDGSLVWSSDAVDATGSFAVAVADGRVHVSLENGGSPKAAALSVTDGRLLWESPSIDFGYEQWQQASSVVHEGIQVLFGTGPDFDPKARPGYALIDAATGALLHAQTTIPTADLDAGFSGGGVWGTPTVDPVDDHLFAATANPYSTGKEHAYDNAVLKIDLDRDRPTFGQVVGSYKGDSDSITGYDNPVCALTDPLVPAHFGGQQTCGQTDVDFGNGPTLWRDETGLNLAILQKTGRVHAVDADTMQGRWIKEVGTNSLLMATSGNLSRIATDGETLWVVANHGFLRALDAATGAERWMAVTAELGAGGNVALANGVVYHAISGDLRGWDAETGAELWRGFTPTNAPAGGMGSPASGVAIAGGRVVANMAGTLVVFALPGQQ